MTLKQQDYADKIDSSAKSLLGIINDILDFSKIEAGKLEMEEVDFHLDDVISNISSMISVKAAEKNIELLSNINSEVPNDLTGDPLRLGQVLANLANNAIKFTDKGHILIKAELIEKDILSCRIKFSVSDTGIGMTEGQMRKLFSAFSQADSSITRKFGGTGLGLTISKRLVEMMNGKIFVESKFGVGSTFIFTSEFKRQPVEKERRVIDKATLSSLKVLVVDDNEMARDILKKQLGSFGISALAVDCGRAAILEIKKESGKKPYNLVFMDWRMPDLDGLETAKIIISDKNISQPPLIVMVTAFGREEVVKKAEEIGINSFLMKPVNQSLLFDTITNLFGMNNAESLTLGFNKNSMMSHIEEINGIKILLVEDNALNQEVAIEILRSAGAAINIANNGREAVEKVSNFHYDVVLMDLQMPVMGGYEATRIIRSDGKHRLLPIIAMTAHAMHGVKEDCLRAGMNDYISKPIDPEKLLSIIKKWVKPLAANKKQQIKGADENTGDIVQDTALPESNPGLDIESGLKRLNGNRKLYRKLLEDFSISYSSLPEDTGNAIKQGDTTAALRLIHTLKGVAGNISAYNIQDTAVKLEKAILQKDKEKCDDLLNMLAVELKDFDNSLKDLAPIKKTKNPIQKNEKHINISEFEPLILKLVQLVWEDNVDAENCLGELRECIDGSRFEKEIQSLSESISNFDFEAAKGPIQRIANEMNIEVRGK
jgi:two-component system, sensor histidine kinase and response regulator